MSYLVLTRAAGTVWVCPSWGHPILPLGKTHFCSDPISSSLQGNQGDPGPPGPPVRSHLAPRAGDCHARAMSARVGIPPGSGAGVAVLGLNGPAAPSLSCATSKHHPNNVPLSPAGQHWPTRDPGPSWCQGKAAALASASALPRPAWQRENGAFPDLGTGGRATFWEVLGWREGHLGWALSWIQVCRYGCDCSSWWVEVEGLMQGVLHRVIRETLAPASV